MAERIAVLQPRKGLLDFDLGGLGEYSELLNFLVWRDLKVRCRQTAAGVLGIGFQPLLTVVVLSVVFGRLAGMLLALLAALSIGLWLAPLNARYRGVGYALPFLLQIGMLASPVASPRHARNFGTTSAVK
jgi:ABC-type polysaccharide/polyol phosphate export permease